MRGATAQELAKAVHAHAIKQVRRSGGTVIGFMVDDDPTAPPTVSVTLRGSSEQIDGVRYVDTFIPTNYSGIPKVVIQVTGDGDLLVIGALA
jgi:hypothetical protein